MREAEVGRACGKACDGGVKEGVVEDWERWKFMFVMCQPEGGISEGGGQARAGADSALYRSQGGWLRRSQLGPCGIFGVGRGSALIFPSSLHFRAVFLIFILLIKSSWQWPLVSILMYYRICACARSEVGVHVGEIHSDRIADRSSGGARSCRASCTPRRFTAL